MPDFGQMVPRTIERFFRLPNRAVSRTFFDLDVEGLQNVPASGAVILAANHFSHLDPPLIAVNLDRYIRFLAVDDLFLKSKAFSFVLEFFGTIPLDRTGYPIRAMREAIDHLEGGGAVGLFPEGRRVERWGEDPPKRGAAWLAWMTGAPLLPIAIVGTEHSLAPGERAFRRTAVKIWVEEPILWTHYEDQPDPVGAMMDDWYEAVNRRVEHWN